ncbi:MAG TPA: hypothetical protein VK854_02955, partial [Woeseiaceae bacterium]|nr:hypothetical protein [Woeseiaceae bacterium]
AGSFYGMLRRSRSVGAKRHAILANGPDDHWPFTDDFVCFQAYRYRVAGRGIAYYAMSVVYTGQLTRIMHQKRAQVA